jgi:hypothetical protein
VTAEYTPVLAAALAFHAAGCSVVPARPDGSKAPIGNWKKYQTERADEMQIKTWLSNGHPGFGLVCGTVSDGLIMVELEGRAIAGNMLARAGEVALAAGDADLWRRITTGYMEATPAGGAHILYRIVGAACPGNQKLARRPAQQPPAVDVLAETRGEGGYVIVAPSGGTTHPTGKAWTRFTGSPATIPNLTLDEHTTICSILRALDEMPTPDVHLTPTNERPSSLGVGSELTPGDDYNQRTSWQQVLEPHGWKLLRQRGTVCEWRRPGKNDQSIAATTGYGDHDLLYVFSTSTLLDSEKSYSKFAALTILEHGGDYRATASSLRSAGYGAPRDVLPPLAPFTLEGTWASNMAASPGASNSTPPTHSTSPTAGIPSTTTITQGQTSTAASTELSNTEGHTLTPDDILNARRAQLEANYYEELRARAEARKRYEAEQVARDFRQFTSRTLREELLLPDEPVAYRVDRILPVEANILLTAKYKTGKTTTIGNLAKTLADGGDFLGKFPVTTLTGGRTVTIFNYELSENQYRRWLRDLNIDNQDAVTVVHLRGINLPLTQEWARERVQQELVHRNTAVWIVDPFARAFIGSGEENSNSDVGAFVAILDAIKRDCGVDELVMPTHTGRSDESGDRARGATRLNDWADVQWLLTADEEGTRYFSASGRDVDVEEEKLSYEESTRGLTMGGGDRKWESSRRTVDKVIEVVTATPGMNATELREAVGGKTATVTAAREQALHSHLISARKDGTSTRFYPPGLVAWTGVKA